MPRIINDVTAFNNTLKRTRTTIKKLVDQVVQLETDLDDIVMSASKVKVVTAESIQSLVQLDESPDPEAPETEAPPSTRRSRKSQATPEPEAPETVTPNPCDPGPVPEE